MSEQPNDRPRAEGLLPLEAAPREAFHIYRTRLAFLLGVIALLVLTMAML